MPADITPYLHAMTPNQIEIISTTQIPHYVVVQLARRLTAQDLLQVLKTRVISCEDATEQVKQSFKEQNSEVLAVSTKLSVLDPLKLSRIIAPGRASTCKHIQCFDLENYLLMNERIRRWRCPLCDKPALFKKI